MFFGLLAGDFSNRCSGSRYTQGVLCPCPDIVLQFCHQFFQGKNFALTLDSSSYGEYKGKIIFVSLGLWIYIMPINRQHQLAPWSVFHNIPQDQTHFLHTGWDKCMCFSPSLRWYIALWKQSQETQAVCVHILGGRSRGLLRTWLAGGSQHSSLWSQDEVIALFPKRGCLR